ncbi:UDP-glycosyltransferase 74B1-like [Senna tora]|uniref:Glycosyltransferase n=1 Tax=Senna tora TaxID=362788 RepID=A0A834X5V6_9FABA|nr:UDP-glycosyltransferase 74B1-like [Senna tora]
MNPQNAHVILLLYPAQGHINPLVQFAKRLVAKGLKATIGTTPYTVNHINAPILSSSIEPISDGYDEAGFKQAPSVQAYLQSYESVGSKALCELILKFRDSDSPVNCIIYDSLLPWALDVAKKFGIFGAVFLTNSASVCSLYWEIKMGRIDFPLDEDKFEVSLPGLPVLEFCDMPSLIARPEEHYAYLAIIMEKFQRLEDNDWVFCNTFQDLENELLKAMEGQWPLIPVGPMIPSAYLGQPTEGDTAYGASLWEPSSHTYMTWVDTKPPASVVFVSFGSMGTTTAKQAQEIAKGLKASKKHFIWVLKESDGKLPPGLSDEDEDDDGGLVVTWCNQVEVLAHPSVGCFVTHCGWNSVIEALSIGVPIVGVAQWSDQPTNAKLVEELWGVGIRARRDSDGILRGEELDKCVREVMDGAKSEGIRRNASKWSESAAKAVSANGSSDKNITKFIRTLMMGKG